VFARKYSADDITYETEVRFKACLPSLIEGEDYPYHLHAVTRHLYQYGEVEALRGLKWAVAAIVVDNISRFKDVNQLPPLLRERARQLLRAFPRLDFDLMAMLTEKEMMEGVREERKMRSKKSVRVVLLVVVFGMLLLLLGFVVAYRLWPEMVVGRYNSLKQVVLGNVA
jgi:hypothetical protein